MATDLGLTELRAVFCWSPNPGKHNFYGCFGKFGHLQNLYSMPRDCRYHLEMKKCFYFDADAMVELMIDIIPCDMTEIVHN